MSNLISFCDFKRTKEHKKKIDKIEEVLFTLNMCMKALNVHKDYLIVQNVMHVINENISKMSRIKDVENLHYENTISSGIKEEEHFDDEILD